MRLSILLPALMASLLLVSPCRAVKQHPSSQDSSHPMAGHWVDERGAQFIVRAKGDTLIWFGQGIVGTAYFFHMGEGKQSGTTIQGVWVELPDSESYPGDGDIRGEIAADGKSIAWQDPKGFYGTWKRKLSDTARKKILATIQESFGKPAPESPPADDGSPGTWDAVGGTIEGGAGDIAPSATPQTWSDVEQSVEYTSKPKPSNPESWADVTAVLQEHQRREGIGAASDGTPNRNSVAAIRDIDDPAGRNARLSEFLSGSEAWKDPEVQRLIDQWLDTAVPEFARKDPTARYERWGRLTGKGITIAGKPEIDEPRHYYLWRNADKFPSLNLCTMRVFVERTLKGESLADCRVGTPGSDFPTKTRLPSKELQALADIPDSLWTNGKPELKGRIVVVIFGSGANTRGAEQAEKDFNKYREYGWGEVDVQYVGLDVGGKKSAKSLASSAGLTFPVAEFVLQEVRKSFEGSTEDTMTYVIDWQGDILARLSGYPTTPAENRELHRLIREALYRKSQNQRR